MNFDYRDNQDNPVELPGKYAVKVENNSNNIDYSEFTYTYPRLILDEIIQGTDKVGFINFRRDPIDKISRRNPTFFKYNDKFYPYLSLKVASDYLKRHEKLDFKKFEITENNDLIVGNRTLPLDETGSMIINWYGANNDVYSQSAILVGKIKSDQARYDPEYVLPEHGKNSKQCTEMKQNIENQRSFNT